MEVRGDGHHFEAVIVSAAFRGKSRVQQHQLVYAALGERMRAEIHALSMQTYTPEDWAGKGLAGDMDKLLIEGGVPLAGEVGDFRRQERGAADPHRGAAHRRSR